MAPLVLVAFFFLVRFLSCFKACLNSQVVQGGIIVLLLGNIVSSVVGGV